MPLDKDKLQGIKPCCLDGFYQRFPNLEVPKAESPTFRIKYIGIQDHQNCPKHGATERCPNLLSFLHASRRRRSKNTLLPQEPIPPTIVKRDFHKNETESLAIVSRMPSPSAIVETVLDGWTLTLPPYKKRNFYSWRGSFGASSHLLPLPYGKLTPKIPLPS